MIETDYVGKETLWLDIAEEGIDGKECYFVDG